MHYTIYLSLILIVISYVLIRVLRAGKYGFTFVEYKSSDKQALINSESLIIAQTFKSHVQEDFHDFYKGGSGGGGGATGEF